MQRRKHAGFSLIELMVVVAMVAILAVIAMNAYLNAQRKGNRGAAEAFLASIAQQEQQYFIDNRGFLGCTDPIVSSTCTLGLQESSNNQTYYTFTVTANNTATPPSFSATATPKAGTYQASDSAGTLSIDSSGNRLPAGIW